MLLLLFFSFSFSPGGPLVLDVDVEEGWGPASLGGAHSGGRDVADDPLHVGVDVSGEVAVVVRVDGQTVEVAETHQFLAPQKMKLP